jgi:hypothetical protein
LETVSLRSASLAQISAWRELITYFLIHISQFLLDGGDAVLEVGSVPLPVVTARIDRFIAEGGEGPYPDTE